MDLKDKKQVEMIWGMVHKKLLRVAVSARDKLPYTTVNGVYDNKYNDDVSWWTNGFFPGMMWLMYDGTKNDEYKITAEHGEKLLDEALKKVEYLNHDVGFMWHLSAGANYRLTGNHDSYRRNMLAAYSLMGRFNADGNYIRAWNDEGNTCDVKGWTIIDCMMNLPILYWATEVTGDDRFKSVAMRHADKTMNYHVRADGSVNHIVEYNPKSGEFVRSFGGQGFGEGSSWSRGQAWGLYGFILSYIHTKEQRYLDTSKRIAHYFISAVCNDWLSRSDFRAPSTPVIYDASAGLIAANGLLELSKYVPEYEQNLYYEAAIRIIEAETEHFADWTDTNDAIIMNGTEAYNNEIHIPMIYSDFFYAEAINKLMGYNTFLW